MRDTIQFTINATGENSGQKFEGLFTAKVKLSHRETLREDEVYRTVLGQNPSEAGPDAASIARAVAYLTIRITDGPDWWKKSGSGLNLEDIDVLAAVNNGAVAAIKEERDAHLKKAEEAQPALKAKAAEE